MFDLHVFCHLACEFAFASFSFWPHLPETETRCYKSAAAAILFVNAWAQTYSYLSREWETKIWSRMRNVGFFFDSCVLCSSECCFCFFDLERRLSVEWCSQIENQDQGSVKFRVPSGGSHDHACAIK
jgi:hypothetical protein